MLARGSVRQVVCLVRPLSSGALIHSCGIISLGTPLLSSCALVSSSCIIFSCGISNNTSLLSSYALAPRCSFFFVICYLLVLMSSGIRIPSSTMVSFSALVSSNGVAPSWYSDFLKFSNISGPYVNVFYSTLRSSIDLCPLVFLLLHSDTSGTLVSPSPLVSSVTLVFSTFLVSSALLILNYFLNLVPTDLSNHYGISSIFKPIGTQIASIIWLISHTLVLLITPTVQERPWDMIVL